VILEVQKLSRAFGGLLAVSELDLEVASGKITGLIGPNGAGKTTIFNLITGFLKATSGRILFEGQDITGRPPHRIAAMGIGRTFQLAYLFPDFTVLQNVVASFSLHPRSNFWQTLFNTPAYRKNERAITERAMELIEMTGLMGVRDELGKNLPHGFQKLLALARALAVRPKLLLLDEPVGGMNRAEIDRTAAVIRKINEQGTTIMLVEHNVGVMDLCHRVVVVNFGKKIAEGTLGEVRSDPEVIRAYFGQSHAA
jgi:branched-chain amino acid transport system ATP-binding protein